MKFLLAALLLVATATNGYAYCTTTTYIQGFGRMVVCTTCCFPGGNCTVSCN
jgi:hypothetical protein